MKSGRDLISDTEKFVRETLEGAEAGHDWSHVDRVRNMALHIREMEADGDPLVIELAALLHDIADPKFHQGDQERGAELATGFLTRNGLDMSRISHIHSIIRHLSFKGGHGQDVIRTVEFRMVQDADRLDAMGAIGIARTFNYGGFRNLPIHDPGIPVRDYGSADEYYASKAPTINHFYEKLLKLKDLMHTATGKAIAEQRHEFMLEFLKQFQRDLDPVRTKSSG